MSHSILNILNYLKWNKSCYSNEASDKSYYRWYSNETNKTWDVKQMYEKIF